MIDESQNLSLYLNVQWNDELATYRDRQFIIKTNFWRDFYPPVMDYQIKRAELNQTIEIKYKADELLVDEFSQSNLKTIPIQLTVNVTDIFEANQQNGGRCRDIAEDVTTNDPGMQTLMAARSSDFFQGMPFLRKIENDDAIFYDSVETKPPVDQVAIEQLSQFYSNYLNNDMKILDLMSGPDSYLPKNLESVDVTGLGLKEPDLQANASLNQYVIHDLNQIPELPFDDQQFDAVICSFSIEYMTQPIAVFQQVARILKPGGTFILGFSDRYYEKKVIALWSDVHSFERMGIVLEYFRQSGEFDDLLCESIKGLIRHEDDPFIDKTAYSCPMFMLSGKQKG